jgi:hypothetical protein
MQNTYFATSAQNIIRHAVDNIQEDKSACCRSCFETPECTLWLYCECTFVGVRRGSRRTNACGWGWTAANMHGA